jgi:glyoxylase-like metal-dependent hydrolase (beta-lactamase superfamily II)
VKRRAYPFTLGAYEGHVLYDFSHAHSAQELGVDLDVEDLEQVAREYAFEVDAILVGYDNLLLRVGERNVLIDAGIRRPMGELHLGLAELGIDLGNIQTIVLTHSDRDHIGGILDADGSVSFPTAEYVMLEHSWRIWSTQRGREELVELNHWTEDRIQFAWETYARIEERILAVASGEEFLPGLRLLAAPGHRYDHSILRVTSEDELLVHLSDAVVHPLLMAHRDWVSTYDADPAQAATTKTELLGLCASEKALVFGAHFPFPGLGYVRSGQGGWRWEPVAVT